MSAKKKTIISISLIVISLLSIFTVAYAWIITRVETPSIDGSTTGVKFTYELKDLNKELNYNIYNISFFDIEREEEKTYFLDMAICVELEIQNTGLIDMIYTVNQVEPTKEAPYIQCIFMNKKIESITEDFKTFIESNKSLSNQEIAVDGSSIVYLYVFGVQPNKDSDNTFLESQYSFSIEIIGEGK